MRHHPAWLAAGLLVFAVLGCNFSAGTNSNSGPLSKVTMAKDNGNGDPGDETNTFRPSDHKIHCLVTLSTPKEGTKITFAWWLVDAGGTKDEKLKELDFTTGEKDNVVHGNLSSARDWPSGKYKVEVLVNGNSEKTVTFTVE